MAAITSEAFQEEEALTPKVSAVGVILFWTPPESLGWPGSAPGRPWEDGEHCDPNH